MERPNAFQFRISCTLVGPELKVGDKAPAFKVVNNDLATVESSAYAGKVRIISSVPSLETGVCSTQTRTFNQAATELGENVVVLTISCDLPFTQKKWCGAAGVDRVITLSDYHYHEFGHAFGTYVKELAICSRAVFVVDSSDTIVHVEYVPAGGQEPNYEAALAAARAAK
ncbi:MAG: thiol peroxidase [Bacillota bacterium]